VYKVAVLAALALSLLTLSIGSHSSSYNGTIKSVMTGPNPTYDGKAFIAVNGAVDQSGSCQNNPSYNYVFDATTPGGKTTLSVVLAAFAAQRPVYIQGTVNNCSLYPGIETLKAIFVN